MNLTADGLKAIEDLVARAQTVRHAKWPERAPGEADTLLQRDPDGLWRPVEYPRVPRQCEMLTLEALAEAVLKYGAAVRTAIYVSNNSITAFLADLDELDAQEDPEDAYDDAREAVPERFRSRMVALRETSPPPAEGEVKIYLIRIVTLDISSTDIRAMIRKGCSIRYLVPSAVEAFINDRRLYREID